MFCRWGKRSVCCFQFLCCNNTFSAAQRLNRSDVHTDREQQLLLLCCWRAASAAWPVWTRSWDQIPIKLRQHTALSVQPKCKASEQTIVTFYLPDSLCVVASVCWDKTHAVRKQRRALLLTSEAGLYRQGFYFVISELDHNLSLNLWLSDLNSTLTIGWTITTTSTRRLAYLLRSQFFIWL